MAAPTTSDPGRATDVANAGDIEDAVRQILERRRKCNASGQRGEDIDLIRAALAGSSLRSTAVEVA
ncbi:hypothetical protein [Xanthomonas euvesicatoria]|uniref:hypothetical protein n=1 Tax=Xanthomonas euvesicatoria TaxID=456327 RepID=UPI001112A4B2|nr:hypothetical protein [Xanthomonas euvesicatoria]MCC8799101.1 hypothetical protein [Xanthomonas euvesicatoria pv. euvesicatoria]MCC8807706.1 hypothetical protein [Xanthomonas euvesicatoria pv. euvesicatoria]MCC8816151.1 hypothetical protein [Xanthomonas euvesicatoria pv. euvesicatoria]